jgi:hypothetical protein
MHCTALDAMNRSTHSEHANSKQIADRATSPCACVKQMELLIS